MTLRPLIVLSLLFALSGLHAATTIVRGPYLQSATPTSMVVRWRTDMTEASVVSYGLERGQLTSTTDAMSSHPMTSIGTPQASTEPCSR